jgi:hypothetical protein
MKDEASVLFISFNAIESALFNMLSGVLATERRKRKKDMINLFKFIYYNAIMKCFYPCPFTTPSEVKNIFLAQIIFPGLLQLKPKNSLICKIFYSTFCFLNFCSNNEVDKRFKSLIRRNQSFICIGK